MKQTTIVKLFNITRQTWTNWKKEEKPIVKLIEKYFNDEDIEEFLEKEKCSKLENINSSSNNTISNKDIRYMLIGMLQEKKKTEIYNYEKEIVLLFRVFEPYQKQMNKDNSKNDLINLIKNYKLGFLKDQFQNSINESTRENAISFINELKEFQIDYIVNNCEEFVKILWDSENIFNKYLSFDRKPKKEV